MTKSDKDQQKLIFEKQERTLMDALAQSKFTLGPTAPRLLTHKPQVAANALRLGLTGQTCFLTPFEMREYLAEGLDLIDDLQPITKREMHLAQCIIDASWRFAMAGALQKTCQTSGTVLESQAIYEANPHLKDVQPGSVIDSQVTAHATAFAVHRMCEGANVLEKLSRHETRLWNLLRSMRQEYDRIHQRGNAAARQAWTRELCPSYTWYKKLSELADRLLEAREELTRKSVTETITISAEGTDITDPDSMPSEAKLFCRKALKIVRTLAKKTLETLEEARSYGLTTELEESIFPIPAPTGPGGQL